MAFPKTETELATQGYTYEDSRACRRCGRRIAFYLTPKGKHIPLDEGSLEPHFSTCEFADEFRKPSPGTGQFSTSNDRYKGGSS